MRRPGCNHSSAAEWLSDCRQVVSHLFPFPSFSVLSIWMWDLYSILMSPWCTQMAFSTVQPWHCLRHVSSIVMDGVYTRHPFTCKYCPVYIFHFHYHNATSCPKSSYNGKLLIQQFYQVLLDFSECQSCFKFNFAFDTKWEWSPESPLTIKVTSCKMNGINCKSQLWMKSAVFRPTNQKAFTESRGADKMSTQF